MKVIFFAFATCTVAWMLSPSYAQTCTDANGMEVGDSGTLDIMLTNGTSFKRKGSDRCPCAYVQATCKLGNPVYASGGAPVQGEPGDNCNELVVNGVDAAANGYPKINMRHVLQLCNYNDNTNNRIKMVEAPARAKVEFLYPDNEAQVKLVDESWNEQSLAPKQCFENIGVKQVQSNRPKYFMEAILQGGQETPTGKFVPGAFCYAYSYNKINIGFVYPPYGQCKMRTELDCQLTDGTGRSCRDYINANLQSCVEFEGTFTAKACNDNARDVQIQEGASNYKINIYEKKPSGQYKRKREDLPDVIKANQCAEFATTRMLKPCEKNFWQVNVEGKEYIADAENGWVFKDKDCLSYSFDTLPVADPNAPTPSPSNRPSPGSEVPSGSPSLFPTFSTTPTGIPSLGPTVSFRPTISGSSPPTLSTAPTGVPTSAPSLSVQPSDNPTLDPTASKIPTAVPTLVPSLSTTPTGVPTFGPSLSYVPSISGSSPPTLSTAPSGAPSSAPTTSVRPTGGPTVSPSTSPAPSVVPTSGPSVSAQPTSTPTSAPTASIHPTSSPSLLPSLSTAPTRVPSSSPTVSVKPTSNPTSDPTVSTGPTSIPSFAPSVSVQPSGSPSLTPTLSVAPSMVPTSGPTVSIAPTGVPTINPSISGNPTGSPSLLPSLSMAPTWVPTSTPSISFQPTTKSKGKSKGKGKAKNNAKLELNGSRRRRRGF